MHRVWRDAVLCEPSDVDVIEWFKAQGGPYQTRMNAVLRGYVDAQKRAATRAPG